MQVSHDFQPDSAVFDDDNLVSCAGLVSVMTLAERTGLSDITHRRHAIIETVFADLVDGPLAHMPSGHFGANSAWSCVPRSPTTCCAPPPPSPVLSTPPRAGPPCDARSSTFPPSLLARPQRKPILHLPSHWPWADAWLAL